MLLTRYEVARLISIRSVSLSEGAAPAVFVEDKTLREDPSYVAAMELRLGKMDAVVVRGERRVHLKDAAFPECLNILLDSKDGGKRGLT